MNSIKKLTESQWNIIVIFILALITILPIFIINEKTGNAKFWYGLNWFFWISVLAI